MAPPPTGTTARTAEAPMSWRGAATVVSPGETRSASRMSSNPTTLTSSGTEAWRVYRSMIIWPFTISRSPSSEPT